MSSLLDYELFEGADFSWKATEDWLHDWRSDVVRSSSMLHRANLSYNRCGAYGIHDEQRFVPGTIGASTVGISLWGNAVRTLRRYIT